MQTWACGTNKMEEDSGSLSADSAASPLKYIEMKTVSQEQVGTPAVTASFLSSSINLLKTLIGAGTYKERSTKSHNGLF
jgi:hypothetical protein